MAGRHAPRAAARTRPTARSFRKFLTSAAAMLVVAGLAATMAVPAVAASATQSSSAVAADADQTQDLTVATSATATEVIRDGFTIGRIYGQAGPPIVSTGGWAAPINRPITSPWGPRQTICTAGVGCDSGFHRGDDFAAACGTPFYAVSGGTVTAITHAGLAGDEIVITHAGNVSTAYAHMFDSGILVQIGQPVSAGQNIGRVGSSGDSTGCHLYFEYRVGGLTVNPVPAMASHGIVL